MTRENGSESLECDLVALREERNQILDALEFLFDLLEEYAPRWYTEDHRQKALSALHLKSRRGS